MFFPLFYFIPKPSYYWGFFALFLSALVSIQLLPPIFKRQPGTTYFERLEKQLSDDKDKQGDETPKDLSLASKIDRYLLTPLGMVIFGLLIVGAMGRDLAQNREQHWVLKDSPNFLLVDSFGDIFVFKSFDLDSKHIGDEVRVLKLHEGTPVPLERRYTGILQGAEKKKPGQS